MATLEAGPYRTIRTSDGESCPWYMIPFDKRGRCAGPATRAHLVEALKTGGYTHVFLFSHGWNNTWKNAVNRYQHFMNGFMQLRREHNLAAPQPYKPLLIGVIWPSASLVLPWERSPHFAGGEVTERDDTLVDYERRCLEDLADDLPDDQLDRFYELVQQRPLDADQALELAGMLAPLCEAGDDELAGGDQLAAADLLAAWLATAPRADEEDDDLDDYEAVGAAGGGPQAAGLLSKLDPRHALRMASVWRMKDRAGTVGAHGVSPLLRDGLAACDAAFHLIGHSYGCKVMLSALCFQPLPRRVKSLLLLQPAVSYLCFADDVDGDGRSGGYRPAFDRVEQPILSTFSGHDFPLTKVFHLAVRRKADLGEQRIAGLPPSRYAALGGFGPGGCGPLASQVDVKSVGDSYDLANRQVQVFGVHADEAIDGHGSISNPATWWALYDQVAAP